MLKVLKKGIFEPLELKYRVTHYSNSFIIDPSWILKK